MWLFPLLGTTRVAQCSRDTDFILALPLEICHFGQSPRLSKSLIPCLFNGVGMTPHRPHRLALRSKAISVLWEQLCQAVVVVTEEDSLQCA
jgi:hypothetical protein